MNKPVALSFTEEAENMMTELTLKAMKSKREKSLIRAIRQKLSLIKQNPFIGQPVSKNLIPAEYILKYNIDSLFRIELPQYWRMHYTLKGNEIEILAFILDIMDHKKYSRKFNYK